MSASQWRLHSTAVIFDMLDDPRPGHRLIGVSDPDVHLIDGRWTMFLGAFTTRFAIRIVEARLPAGAPVTDPRWRFETDGRARALIHGAPAGRASWDRVGMHTPCYVRGAIAGRSVERIYYAGRATTRMTGPGSRYAIGCLERHDGMWSRHEGPVLRGDAHRPSVLEPRVIYAGGRWRMWFLAAVGETGRGAQPDYQLRYCESDDGLAWSAPSVFATTAEGFFDNAVQHTGDRWEMLLARGTNLHGTVPFPSQGLWWSQSRTEPGARACWSPPIRLLDTAVASQPWFAAGVCGPSFVYERDGGALRLHVFATGTRRRTSWWRAATRRLAGLRRPPAPAPYYLATGRLTFTTD